MLINMPQEPDKLPTPRDYGRPYRICLVCLGNICRSPMAEMVLRAHAEAAGLDVSIDSAGTGDWHIGQPMYGRARQQLARRGYDGEAHRARQFQPEWLADRDLVLAMDASNLADLEDMAASSHAERERIRLFGDAGGLDGADIPDPYGGSDADFARVLDMLEAAAPRIMTAVGQLHAS